MYRAQDSQSFKLWTGTTSTSWQHFVIYNDVSIGSYPDISLGFLNPGGAGYVEFDDVSLTATDISVVYNINFTFAILL